jgi:addiction module HigA family antidote
MNNHPVTVTPPGETLREMLHARGLHAEAFALATGIPHEDILSILAGKTAIRPEHAERFEHILNVSSDFWLRRQNEYDVRKR